MQQADVLHVLKSILTRPTAPFHEYEVRDAILGLLAGCAHVTVTVDAFGNLIARYARGAAGDDRAAWAFGSHMDHPGWVRSVAGATEPPVSETHRRHNGFTFLGGVPPEYFSSPALREFGDFAMWDLVDFEAREDGTVHSRACDDLVGCAAIVCALLDLEQRGIEAVCYGIFTRAEEVGFVGAIELAKNWPLPKETIFVSIETSVATGTAIPGGGPMCRVGDRLSIFDHAATSALLAVAVRRGLPVQRALLDRGSCEASALQAYGIRTAGISVALGHYHNCGPELRIAAEFVHLADVETLVALLSSVIEELPNGPGDPGAGLRERFEARVASHAPYIRETRGRFGGPPAEA
jgi:putative aminopeptidase FrvX